MASAQLPRWAPYVAAGIVCVAAGGALVWLLKRRGETDLLPHPLALPQPQQTQANKPKAKPLSDRLHRPENANHSRIAIALKSAFMKLFPVARILNFI